MMSLNEIFVISYFGVMILGLVLIVLQTETQALSKFWNWLMKLKTCFFINILYTKHTIKPGTIVYYGSSYWVVVKLINCTYTIFNLYTKRVETVDMKTFIHSSIIQNDLLEGQMEYECIKKLYSELGEKK